MGTEEITRKQLIAIGTVAGCDCRTVKAFLDGKRVQKRFRVPITAALGSLGYSVEAPK